MPLFWAYRSIWSKPKGLIKKAIKDFNTTKLAGMLNDEHWLCLYDQNSRRVLSICLPFSVLEHSKHLYLLADSTIRFNTTSSDKPLCLHIRASFIMISRNTFSSSEFSTSMLIVKFFSEKRE